MTRIRRSRTGILSLVISLILTAFVTAAGLVVNDTGDAAPPAPAAVGVTVSGRVMRWDGRAVPRARVSIANVHGTSRMALTNPFGYYRFTDVFPGLSYVFTVTDRRYLFNARIVTVQDEMPGLDFVALP